MASFSYVATNKSGDVIQGNIEASDRPGALSALTKQGLSPLSIDSLEKKGLASISFGGGKKKVKTDYIVMFTRQMSAMVSAGVPLLRALSSQHDHTDSPALKAVLGDIIKDVQSGMQLADALSKHPATFNDVYVNMVRAGEAGGILDDILRRLAIQQEKSAGIRKKIKGAMTYPLVLLVITIMAFLVLMVFVIPQIGEMIKGFGGEDAELPALTQVMLSISGFLTTKGYLLIPVLIAIVYFLRRWLNTTAGKHTFHRLVLKIPAISSIIQKVAVARFARTFSALMGSGAAVLESLEVTSHSVGNVVYEEALLKAAKEVENGKNLSTIIEKTGLFPPIVSQMLAVGEETGQTDVVLVKVADFYEEEVDVAIDSIGSIIEPVMIVLMGGMVGLIAASVMMPIAGLSTSIKQ